MDDSSSISQLGARDAPTLMMTEKLVVCLRACTLFATTRRAARVRLLGPGNGFASELTLISNQGLDALVDAFKFLNKIRLTADSMAKEGGTLERLQSTVGVPAERRSHDRLMARLKHEIESCTSGGEGLDSKLGIWGKDIRKFQTRISTTNETYIHKSEEKEAEMGRYDYELKSTRKLLRQNEKEGAEAETKYTKSQANQDSLNAEMLLLPERIAWTAIRIGVNLFVSKAAAADVKKTQEEVERRRRDAERYENEIQEAELEVRTLSGESTQLDEFTKALSPTLRALVSLTDNLRALILGFATIKKPLDDLVERQKDQTSISQDVRMEPATSADIRDFRENAREMGAFTLKIQYLAWMYASIIENVLIGGLESVHSAADGDIGGSFETLDFFQIAQRQQLYLQGNGSSCDSIKSQVDAKYEQERLAMEQRHAFGGEKLTKAQVEAERRAKKQEAKPTGSKRLNIVSRK